MADAVIVGGGPAGSSCAWALTRAGLSVVVVDRAVFPRDKVCAGWITVGALSSLGIDPTAYAEGCGPHARQPCVEPGRVLQPITGFRTARLGDREIVTRYRRPVSYGIRRCEFDTYLLQRSGARLHCGASATRFERIGDRWVVDGAVAAPILIGAGGHFCPVARLLNPGHRDEPVVVAQEIEIPLSAAEEAACRVEPDTPELYLCPDLKGYGWCFRKERYLNVGFGRQDRHGLSHHVQGFLDFLLEAKRIPPALPARWHGHAYLLHGSAGRRKGGEGVLLVGDAAGLAYAQSGEGIRPAIESGLLAAETVIAAGGRLRRQHHEAYERALDRRFGGGAVPSPPSWLAGWLAPHMLRNRWFTRHVLLDRWFLHAHQPALAA